MKKALCAILSAVVMFTSVLANPLKAEAIEPISIAAGVITSMISTALSNYITDSANRAKYRQQMNEAFGNSAFDGVATVTADDLWGAYAQLNSQHVPVEIHTFTFNNITYYGLMGIGTISYPDGSVLSGTGVDITNRWMQYTYLSGNVPMFLRVGSTTLPSNQYAYYNYNQLTGISSILQNIRSSVSDISSAISTTNQKLDNLYSAITGQSSVVAEARSIIEQLSVYTSTSDLSNAAQLYWSRCFVDPTSSFPMVYVTYEDLAQLVLDLANIGVTTRIYYDEAKQIYVIRDVGAWIIDPNTRSDYYSSTFSSNLAYHFLNYYFSLGRGQVICSTSDSSASLLTLLNTSVQGINTSLNDLSGKVDTINSRLLDISNSLSNISSHVLSCSVLLQTIVDYLERHDELDGISGYAAMAGSLLSGSRYIPYETMEQMVADINSYSRGKTIVFIDSNNNVFDNAVLVSAWMRESWSKADSYTYQLLLTVRKPGNSTDYTAVLVDNAGRGFSTNQYDNYLFRIYNRVDDIYNWLDSVDLLTGEDIETMISNTNSKVLQFLPFSNNFIQMVNNVFPASPSIDWAGMNTYLQTVGRDPE